MNSADSRTVAFRVDVKEWNALQLAAEKEGLSVGAYAKKAVLASIGVNSKVRRSRSA